MENTMFSNLSQYSMNFYQPMFKFNQLVLSCCEKVARVQTDTLKTFAEMGLDNFHNAVAIKDSAQMNEFLKKQTEILDAVSKKIAEDVNSYVAITSEMGELIAKLPERDDSQIQEVTSFKKPA